MGDCVRESTEVKVKVDKEVAEGRVYGDLHGLRVTGHGQQGAWKVKSGAEEGCLTSSICGQIDA